MPTFRPLTETDVIAIGTGLERAVWDLKTRYPLDKKFEAAKDVAAFANHVGGVILIGAEESSGVVGTLHPLSDRELNDTKNLFSNEVTQRCRPKPTIEFVQIRSGTGHLLAINVWPSLAGPVGVKIKADKVKEGWGGDAFVFPIRVGSDTSPDFIAPENLAMFMTPHVRRATVMLNKISSTESISIVIHNEHTPGSNKFTWRLLRIEEEENSLLFEDVSSPGRQQVYPLDRVRSVFKDKTQWTIIFDPVFH